MCSHGPSGPTGILGEWGTKLPSPPFPVSLDPAWASHQLKLNRCQRSILSGPLWYWAVATYAGVGVVLDGFDGSSRHQDLSK